MKYAEDKLLGKTKKPLWRDINREAFLMSSRKSERKRKLKTYGLTEEEYSKKLSSQNNVCAICKQDNRLKRDWHVDHCHTTGLTRGILCHHCNLMLGNAKDNIVTLQSGIDYLKEYSNHHAPSDSRRTRPLSTSQQTSRVARETD